ncbi:MAG: hypothetical protein CO167_09280, partial [Candidatus Marinimicrobia bacterium CG_4_9_14_3_um_filter_48_9]
MKKFLRNLVTPGSFASGIAMLTSGAGLGQLFLFLSSPILMRLYPPAVFGELAILISFTSIVAIIVTLRFEAAIPISDNDHTAHELIFIALFFATSF